MTWADHRYGDDPTEAEAREIALSYEAGVFEVLAHGSEPGVTLATLAAPRRSTVASVAKLSCGNRPHR